INMYIEPSNLITTNASKNFISKKFLNNVTSLAIKVKKVPIKAYNLISKVKRYYVVIYCAFKIITSKLETTTLPKH
ncbi:hypothetical protein BDW02DRAFT_513457, partial [Decorospora gaudefroyi]